MYTMPYFKNENVNILLIHIPKTGGSSLEEYFSNKYNIPLNQQSLAGFLSVKNQIPHGINSSLQHMTYNTIMNHHELFNIKSENLTILTIVRNPYERIVSDLFFLRKINKYTTSKEVFKVIQEYLLNRNLDNHNLAQHLFITKDKVLVPNIKILRTESLTSDMQKLGYTDFNRNVMKNSVKINWRVYLNNDSITLINFVYDYDFKLFNYTKFIV